VVLDGVDAETMTSLFVFVSTGRLSPLHLILLLAWVRNDALALLDFITRNDTTYAELHAFADGVGMLTAFARSGLISAMSVPSSKWQPPRSRRHRLKRRLVPNTCSSAHNTSAPTTRAS